MADAAGVGADAGSIRHAASARQEMSFATTTICCPFGTGATQA